MTRFKNRLVRLAAFVALAAVTTTTLASAWHAGDDDAACIQVVVSSSDGAARTIETAPPPAGDPQHCLLCHWTRWFRSIPSTRAQVTAPCERAIRFVLTCPVTAQHQTCGLTPGRAPPA